MHICAVAGGLPSAKNPSTGIFFLRLLEALRDAGHRISLIVPARKGSIGRYARLPDGIAVFRPSYVPYGGLRWIGIDRRTWAAKSFADAVVECFFSEDITPDVVLAHFLVPCGVAAARISKATGVPSFCSIGESDCSRWFAYMRESEILELLLQFRCLFPVSAAIAEFLQRRCAMPPDRIEVAPNGVVSDLFNPGVRRCRRVVHREGHPGKKIALFVGSAVNRKGAYLLRAASRRLKGWEVWLVGPGHRWPALGNIRTFGAVEQRMLPAFYRQADVFVLPSKAEGMPNALLEAMTCGTPAVVSRIPVTVEVLGADYPHFCDLRPQSVADAVIRAGEVGHVDYPPAMPWTVRDRADVMIRHIIRHLEDCGRRQRWEGSGPEALHAPGGPLLGNAPIRRT
jgi:glycosyltransferase involved in cell wall biosynthesis